MFGTFFCTALAGVLAMVAVVAADGTRYPLATSPVGDADASQLVGGWITDACVNGVSCTDMAASNIGTQNGSQCTSVTLANFWENQNGTCVIHSCIMSCAKDGLITGGLCKSWDWWCTDDSLVNSPGNCGDGIQGKCKTTYSGQNGSGNCFASGACGGPGTAIKCGVARSCK